MSFDADVLIIGGGLAGLTASIHLAQQGIQVLLIEKHTYPQHKVCGEYISNEVVPYLHQLGVFVKAAHPTNLRRFLFSTALGKTVTSQLPLGGFGLSRYTLDALLHQKALSSGVIWKQDQVTSVDFKNDYFVVSTATEQQYRSKIVIGAYGKRSSLDKRLQRAFMAKASSWIGVKAHYQADFPDDLVALHTFNGGYCGLSKVEDNVVNACYLANYASFKRYKSVASFQQQVLMQNPLLSTFFTNARPLFDKPLTISQISFAQKNPIDNHILMCGDTAGVIHPLCGNGMAMAIHSAKIAAELILDYYKRNNQNRDVLENDYQRAWRYSFKSRLATGRFIQSLLQRPAVASVLLSGLQMSPALLPLLIKQTHGKPLVSN